MKQEVYLEFAFSLYPLYYLLINFIPITTDDLQTQWSDLLQTINSWPM